MSSANEKLISIRAGETTGEDTSQGKNEKSVNAPPRRLSFPVCAYCSWIDPIPVALLCFVVWNSALSDLLKRGIFATLTLVCLGSGALSVISLLGIKKIPDALIILPGAAVGILANFFVGQLTAACLLLAGLPPN